MSDVHLIWTSASSIVILYSPAPSSDKQNRGDFFMLDINDARIEVQGETLLTIERLRLEPAITFELIGRNGCGKTTLFNYIYCNRNRIAVSNSIKLVPHIKAKDTRKRGGENTKSYFQKAMKVNARIMLLDQHTTHL